jgi:hypothetical protein
MPYCGLGTRAVEALRPTSSGSEVSGRLNVTFEGEDDRLRFLERELDAACKMGGGADLSGEETRDAAVGGGCGSL